MSHMLVVERSFTVRRKAERWFESIRARTWPYVWCVHDAANRKWNVRALVEQEKLPAILSGTAMDGCIVRPYH